MNKKDFKEKVEEIKRSGGTLLRISSLGGHVTITYGLPSEGSAQKEVIVHRFRNSPSSRQIYERDKYQFWLNEFK